jgi:hypothetical protein
MKAFRGVGVWLPSFSTLVLDGGEWLTSRPGRFIAWRKPTYTFHRGLDGLQNQSGRFGEETNFLPLLWFELQTVWPIAWTQHATHLFSSSPPNKEWTKTYHGTQRFITHDVGLTASRGKDLSILQNAPTSYGAHEASYWMGTSCIFPQCGWSLTLHSGEVKNEWSYTSTPMNGFMACTWTLPLSHY